MVTKRQQIYEAIATHPSINVYELVEQVGVSRSYASEVVTRLAMDGQVRKQRQGKRIIASIKVKNACPDEPPLKRCFVPVEQLNRQIAQLPFEQLQILGD